MAKPKMGRALSALLGRKFSAKAETPPDEEDKAAKAAEDSDQEDAAEEEKEGQEAKASDDPEKDEAAAEPDPEDEEMAEDEDKEGGAGEAAAPAASAPKRSAEFERGRRAGLAQGAERERVRWATVFGSDAAKGRELSASVLLAAGDMPATSVVAALSAMPKGGGQDFTAVMDSLGNPELGAGGEAAKGDDIEAAAARRLSIFKGEGK